jgi:L-lactate dehydrogenase complex protein LldF
VLAPALTSLALARNLPNASTFCGRCAEVCPVRIPLPKLLRRWREREARAAQSPAGQRWGLAAWRWMNRWPFFYRYLLSALGLSLRSLSVPGERPERWIRRLPWPGSAWTRCRDMRAPQGVSFQARWREQRSTKRGPD